MRRTLQLLTVMMVGLTMVSCDKYFDPETERDGTRRDDGKEEHDAYCRDLKAKIASTREGTDEYKRLMHQYREKCGGDQKEEVNCDELARKIKATRPGTDEYKRLMSQYEHHCKRDENTDDYCTNLRKKIANTRKGTDEYNRLMKMYEEKCDNIDL